jgi:pimeloyl-ACP methyl ester carboxylesterase
VKALILVLALVAAILLLGAVATQVIARWVEATYPPRGRFVPVSGGKLHVVDTGPAAGTPLATIVLLHGASSNLEDPMLALGRSLADRYRVIAIDRPGHGWSDRGPESAHPARQAELIAETLRELKVRSAVVVGHSFAGSVVPNLALDHPDVTGATLYLAPVTHPWPGGAISWYYGPASHSWFGWLLTRTFATPLGWLLLNPTVKIVFAPQQPFTGYSETARIPLVLRPPVFQANAEDVAGLYAAVRGQQSRYRDIRLPTTIISGDLDTIVWTNLHSRGLAREVPGAKLIVLPGVGHMPHHAAPDLVLHEIELLADAAAAR